MRRTLLAAMSTLIIGCGGGGAEPSALAPTGGRSTGTATPGSIAIASIDAQPSPVVDPEVEPVSRSAIPLGAPAMAARPAIARVLRS